MARDVASYRLYQQIASQPAELRRALVAPEPIAEAAEVLGNAWRVFCVGTGTSTSAAIVAGYLLRRTGIDASTWAAHDMALYPPRFRPGDAALVFSHTGRKRYSRESLAAFQAAGVPAVWIAGREAEDNPATVVLRTVGRETSAAYTVSHTTAMLLAARIADAIAPGSIGDVAAVPDAVAEAVATGPAVAGVAQRMFPLTTLFAVGGGPHESAAHEVAIKVAEAARLRCRGYATEQFLHGPQAQVQAGDSLLVFSSPGPAEERSVTVAEMAQAVRMSVTWVGPTAGPEGTANVRIPDIGDMLAPLVEVIPAQWLAAHLAALADVDADNFRMDEPAFAAAYARYGL